MTDMHTALVQMGFGAAVAQEAIEKTDSLPSAIEWILNSNAGQGVIIPEGQQPNPPNPQPTIVEPPPSAPQISPDDAFHSFEPISPVPGPTDPSRSAVPPVAQPSPDFSGSNQVGGDIPPIAGSGTQAELDAILRRRRRQRAEEEKAKKVEDERRRRENARMMQHAKEMNDDVKRNAERQKRKREREIEKRRKELLLQQLKAEKEMRRNNRGRLDAATQPANPGITAQRQASVAPPPVAIDKSLCNIRVKQPDGTFIPPRVFEAQSRMSAVYEYVDSARTDGSSAYELIGGFPRRTYTRSLPQTLGELGFAPSMSLMMQ